MEITSLIPHIEALIFASDKPLTSLDITELLNNAFGFMEDKITLDQVEASLEGILEKYQSEFYPFEVRQSGGGWQFLTKRDFHKTIAQLNGDKFLKRLSAAALETLSIVAYKQPVTKGEIEAIRGVSSDYAVQKLLEKELIIISGRNETMPGHPLIYTTSKNFMDYFGINTAEDLPKIREVLADQQIEPTSMKDMVQTGEAGDAAGETTDDPTTGDDINTGTGNGQDEVTGTDDTDTVNAGDETTAEADAVVTVDDESDTVEADDETDATADDDLAAGNDDLLSVTEDGQLIGRMEDDDEEQS